MTEKVRKQSTIKTYKLIIHTLVMLVIMVGFASLEPIATLTPLGMKLTGIFLAMLYGWTVSDLLWVSLVGMLAIPFSGAFESFSDFLAVSFGNETIVFLIFMFGFTELLSEVGLVNWIANRMISFKFINNRPWIFSFMLILAAYLIAYVNMFAAILVPWGILYVICERFDFKPHEKYPTLMIMGITLASIIGGIVMPFQPLPIVVMSAYSQISGAEINFFKHIVFTGIFTFVLICVYVLICRFVFRPELKELKHVNIDFADKNALHLNTRQKIVLGFFIAFILLVIAPNILPDSAFVTVLDNWGVAGITILLVVLMTIIPYKGEALMDFNKMSAKGMNWGICVTLAFILPFASIYTSEATGVQPFVTGILQPIINNLPPVAVVFVLLGIGAILTNFMNNMIIGAIFTAILYSVSASINMAMEPILAVLIICASLAMATPAACPNAAVMFANKEWCRSKDLYVYGIISVLILLIFTLIVGYAFAVIIY